MLGAAEAWSSLAPMRRYSTVLEAVPRIKSLRDAVFLLLDGPASYPL